MVGPKASLPPLLAAILFGMEHCVPLLSSYGALRAAQRRMLGSPETTSAPILSPLGGLSSQFLQMTMMFTSSSSGSDTEQRTVTLTAEALCGAAEGSEHVHPSVPKGSGRLLSWLEESRDWTPLHHIEALSKERALALLRDGADTLPSTSLARVSTPQRHGSRTGAKLHAGSPSPLERARAIGDTLSLYERVEVHGLTRAALNGLVGVVVGFDEEKGRCVLRLEERPSPSVAVMGLCHTRHLSDHLMASRSAGVAVGDCSRNRRRLEHGRREARGAPRLDQARQPQGRAGAAASSRTCTRAPPPCPPTPRPPLPPPLTHRSRPTRGTCPAAVATHE